MMLTEFAHKLFSLGKLRGVGALTLEKLATSPGIASATISDIATANPRVAKAVATPSAWTNAQRDADAELEAASKANAKIMCALDSDYPALLNATPDRPFFLFVQGLLSPTPERSVTIIGTREPTDHGRVMTERIADFFARDGWSIVSGLALGCDAIAHEAALHAHGHTVAVLAHGLQTIAPKQHANLAAQIRDGGGALVTEYGFGVEPAPHQFVKRDRIQAGLARGVVMVQSDVEGGSLHASRASIDYGRLLAVPFPTERDIEHKERKIEANLVLCGPNEKQRMELLKCEADGLRHIFVLQSKDQYKDLSRALLGTASQ